MCPLIKYVNHLNIKMAMKKNVLAFAGWVCFALIVVSCDSDQGNACPKDFVGALTG